MVMSVFNSHEMTIRIIYYDAVASLHYSSFVFPALKFCVHSRQVEKKAKVRANELSG